MKRAALLTMVFLGALACVAEAREQWRVERYGDLGGGTYGFAWSQPEDRNSWWPRITLGWPLRPGRWLIKWEGSF